MFVADPKPAPAPAAASPRSDSAELWRRLIEPIDPFLEAVSERLFQQVDSFDPGLTAYAEYALSGNGKHLRPALVALSARALGKLSEDHTSAAVVIEMVHLATLVHDDVMDDADLRRGRLTLAANWGNDIAVLFGDCLFAQALTLAASFPTPEVCRAVASATNTVCAGEILQNRSRGNVAFSQAEYFKVIDMKTAELFALSCDLAAFLSDASGDQRAAVRKFGRAFGTAYQVYDDCLDLFGTEDDTGKSLGTDLAKGKLTLPLIELRERAATADQNRIESWLRSGPPQPLSDVHEMLSAHEVLPVCLARIQHFLEAAEAALDPLPDSAGKAGLGGCARYLRYQAELLGSGCSF